MTIVQHRSPTREPVIRRDVVHRVVVALALGALFALALGAAEHRSPVLGLAVFAGALGIGGVLADDRAERVALARHRPGGHRRVVPLSPDRAARPARHHQEDPVDFRTSAQKASGSRQRDRDVNREHVVEYVLGVPFAEAGRPKKVRVQGRREAGRVAAELRGQGATVRTVRPRRFLEW